MPALRPRRRAAAVVEFALVVPFLFAILLGIVEFGRALMVYQVLNNASRQGARLAVVSGSTVSSVKSAVNGLLAASTITGANVSTIKVNGTEVTDLSTTSAGDPVAVTVSVPYSQVSWLPRNTFLSSATLSSTTVMRRE